MEADVPSFATTAKRQICIAGEKGHRLKETHPRRAALEGNTRARLKKDSPRHACNRLSEEVFGGVPDREPLPDPTVCPRTDLRSWKCHIAEEVLEARDATLRGAEAVRLLRTIGPATTIYTDGSAEAGSENGGNAWVATRGDPGSPEVFAEGSSRGARYTSSFDEELAALSQALDWAADAGPPRPLAFSTDSKSLLEAIESAQPNTNGIRTKLRALGEEVHLVWVPGHSGVPGNERADAGAGAAASCRGLPHRPMSFAASKATIRRKIIDAPPSHPRIADSYRDRSINKEKDLRLNRRQSVVLAQLRAGHCSLLAEYQHRIGRSDSPMCPRCGEEEETVLHWLTKCPAGLAARLKIFGTLDVGLGVLSTDPGGVLALARGTFGPRLGAS